MPQPNPRDELSPRHLPDISDSSFSFQIPGSVPEENLLADIDLDFFRGANLTPLPPAMPAAHSNEPLTLSQLTPRPVLQKQAPRSRNTSKSSEIQKFSMDDSTPELKPEVKKETSSGQRPPVGKFNTEGISQPRPKSITTSVPHFSSALGSMAGARLDVLRAQLDSLAYEDSQDQELTATETQLPKGIRRRSLEKNQPRLRPEKREKRTRIKQTASEGGVAMQKSMQKSNEIAAHASSSIVTSIMVPDTSLVLSPLQQPECSKDLNGDEHSLTDTSVISFDVGGGVAARLVQYSHKLTNSFGLQDFNTFKDLGMHSVSICQDTQTETSTDVCSLQQETVSDADLPLTVSQLSPRKNPSHHPTPPANVPDSPLRPPSKRPASAASGIFLRKKSKIDPSPTDAPFKSEISTRAMAKSRYPSTRKHPKLTGSDSTGSRLQPTTVNERGISRTKARGNMIACAKQAPVFKPRSSEILMKNDAAGQHTATSHSSASSNAKSTSTSDLRISPRLHAEEPEKMKTSLSLKRENKASSSVSSLSSAKPVARDPFHSTIPVGFKFQTDSRLEERKGDHGKESTNSNSRSRSQRDQKPIPDFKALHAAQEAELALRKENIQPTVPLPIMWETDQRVKERQKFDEMVKEKEREQERLLEERRREREEQEEREVRELRKKAVPKAHEVPEWYKEAPKKKKDKAVDAVGS